MCYMTAGRPRVGVRELRQNLSVHLRRVRERSETLEVTERGVPVALLTPLPEGATTRARLIAEGKLIPARRDLAGLGPPLDIPVEIPISQALNELREEIC